MKNYEETQELGTKMFEIKKPEKVLRVELNTTPIEQNTTNEWISQNIFLQVLYDSQAREREQKKVRSKKTRARAKV